MATHAGTYRRRQGTVTEFTRWRDSTRGFARDSRRRLFQRVVLVRELEAARRACGPRGSALAALPEPRRWRAGAAIARAVDEAVRPLPSRWLRARRPPAPGADGGGLAETEARLVAAAEALRRLQPGPVAERVGLQLLDAASALERSTATSDPAVPAVRTPERHSG
jgi:hypothetical protein